MKSSVFSFHVKLENFIDKRIVILVQLTARAAAVGFALNVKKDSNYGAESVSVIWAILCKIINVTCVKSPAEIQNKPFAWISMDIVLSILATNFKYLLMGFVKIARHFFLIVNHAIHNNVLTVAIIQV